MCDRQNLKIISSQQAPELPTFLTANGANKSIIDYIIVSEYLVTPKATTMTRDDLVRECNTDHLPIIAHMLPKHHIALPKPPTKHKWRLERCSDPKVKEQFHKLQTQELHKITLTQQDSNTIQSKYNRLTDSIIKAAQEAVTGRTVVPKITKKFMTKEAKAAIQDRQASAIALALARDEVARARKNNAITDVLMQKQQTEKRATEEFLAKAQNAKAVVRSAQKHHKTKQVRAVNAACATKAGAKQTYDLLRAAANQHKEHGDPEELQMPGSEEMHDTPEGTLRCLMRHYSTLGTQSTPKTQHRQERRTWAQGKADKLDKETEQE